MGGVTGFLNIVAATGGAALLLYSTDALFYWTDERCVGISACLLTDSLKCIQRLVALSHQEVNQARGAGTEEKGPGGAFPQQTCSCCIQQTRRGIYSMHCHLLPACFLPKNNAAAVG